MQQSLFQDAKRKKIKLEKYETAGYSKWPLMSTDSFFLISAKKTVGMISKESYEVKVETKNHIFYLHFCVYAAFII